MKCGKCYNKVDIKNFKDKNTNMYFNKWICDNCGVVEPITEYDPLESIVTINKSIFGNIKDYMVDINIGEHKEVFYENLPEGFIIKEENLFNKGEK